MLTKVLFFPFKIKIINLLIYNFKKSGGGVCEPKIGMNSKKLNVFDKSTLMTIS